MTKDTLSGTEQKDVGASRGLGAADLERLIERCQSAVGPDRELDCRIRFFISPDKGIYYGYCEDHGWAPRAAVEKWTAVQWAENSKEASRTIPAYTASIDAALTLVPTGSYGFAYPWFYSEYSHYEKSCVFWRAAVHKPIWEKATPSLAGDDWFERHECNNDTPTAPLALCIAALKARLAELTAPTRRPSHSPDVKDTP